jgi:capsular exopolysaccharide synthesis family protein
MLSASGKPPGVIMVTSANPSEGKTMIASNLALTLSLDGHRSVIIDCDLRKPRVHKIFQLESQPGLTNYLSGSATLEEIIRPTSIPDLMLISAGARPPSPGNLLNSEVFKKLLIRLREQFHHIVIDTPPLLGFADGRIISAMVDGVMIVVKHNSTHKTAGRMVHQLLSQIHAPIIGAVLNSVGKHSQVYGGYYYHYYYDKYYSKYYS